MKLRQANTLSALQEELLKTHNASPGQKGWKFVPCRACCCDRYATVKVESDVLLVGWRNAPDGAGGYVCWAIHDDGGETC